MFCDKLAGVRAEYVPPDPPDRLVHEPVRQVRCDLWFPHESLLLGSRQEGTPLGLVMTSTKPTFAGFFPTLMLPSRKAPDLLGGMWSLLKAQEPQSKGMVEHRNRFFSSSFMPGQDFASPPDFNEQMPTWLPIANSRHPRSTRARAIDLIGQHRAAMRSLSPVVPDVLFRNTVRLPRDHHIRVHSNDHSVAPALIGWLVDVTGDLEHIHVAHNGVTATTH